MKSIYLAGPYSPPKGINHTLAKCIMETRFQQLTEIAGKLMQDGYYVYSPITHSHPISLTLKNSLSYDFWLEQDRYWMNHCDECWVAKLPGWYASKGVKYEKWYFMVSGKPVKHLEV